MNKDFLHKNVVLTMLLLGGYAGSAVASNLTAQSTDNKIKAVSIAKSDEEEIPTYIKVCDDEDGMIVNDFDDALIQANKDKTKIILLTDAKYNNKLGAYIPLSGCKEIDLNGHTLTVSTNFTIKDGSETVVISDSKGNGKIIGNISSNTLLYNNTNATLIIKGGTITPSGSYASTYYADSNGKLIIYDGTFELGTGRYQFSLKDGSNSSIEIYGGKFSRTDYTWENYVKEPYKYIQTSDGTYRVGIPTDKIALNYGDNTAEYLKTFEKGLLIDTNENDEDYTKWLSKMTVGEDLADVDVTLKRNFIDGKWNPLYLPYAITTTADMLADFDVAEIWDTELVDGATTLEFKTLKEGESIPSYTPFIVRPRNGSTEFTATATTIEATAKAESECSTIKQRFTFYGVLENTKLNENHGYYLDATNNAMMYATNTEKYVLPLKFYMTIQDKATGDYVVPAAQQSRVAIRVIGDETNGINSINDNREKMSDNRVFNMQGIMVGTSTMGLPKGVYLQNGRKVLVK